MWAHKEQLSDFAGAQASLLGGASDGRSVSLVYYFALPEGFEASHMENDAAMDLARRFIHDGREADK